MPKRLLVVEDDLSLRRLYCAEFEDDGYAVRSVGSGEAALDEVAVSPPDVVVLDVHLPGANGLETLRTLLERHPEMRVVLNSAYPGYKADFASWSADGYVVKSSDLSELKAAVAGATGRGARAA